MSEVLNKYKGVIMFILVVVVMFSMYTNRIKELNSLEQQNNQVACYEK